MIQNHGSQRSIHTWQLLMNGIGMLFQDVIGMLLGIQLLLPLFDQRGDFGAALCGDGVGVDMPEFGVPLEIGKGRIVREGTSVALLSLGTRLSECLLAAETLAAHGLTATVADARFAKPLDVDLVLRLAREHEVLITVEEGAIGGFGSYVLQALAQHGALDHGLKVRAMVLPDAFIDQDSPTAMYAKAGLDAKGIVAKVFEALGKDARREIVQLVGKSSPKGA